MAPSIFLVEGRRCMGRGRAKKRGEAPMACSSFWQISFVHRWDRTKKTKQNNNLWGICPRGAFSAVQLGAISFSRPKIINLFSAFPLILPSIKPPSSSLTLSHAKISVVSALLSQALLKANFFCDACKAINTDGLLLLICRVLKHSHLSL